jgi:hypothetical protein
VLVLRFGRKNWVWEPLLAVLLVIATWSAWPVGQAVPVTVLVLFAGIAIASLLTIGRNAGAVRRRHEMCHTLPVATVFVTLSPALTPRSRRSGTSLERPQGCSFTMAPRKPNPSD